jgi:hypothetical protein
MARTVEEVDAETEFFPIDATLRDAVELLTDAPPSARLK